VCVSQGRLGLELTNPSASESGPTSARQPVLSLGTQASPLLPASASELAPGARVLSLLLSPGVAVEAGVALGVALPRLPS
jgi:hypothetical protein